MWCALKRTLPAHQQQCPQEALQSSTGAGAGSCWGQAQHAFEARQLTTSSMAVAKFCAKVLILSIGMDCPVLTPGRGGSARGR